MKKDEIKIGGHYLARVSGLMVTVRVESIQETDGYKTGESYWIVRHPSRTRYTVTNLKTGRTLTFHSAQKFRGHGSTVVPAG